MAVQCLAETLAVALGMVLITISNNTVLKLRAHSDFDGGKGEMTKSKL